MVWENRLDVKLPLVALDSSRNRCLYRGNGFVTVFPELAEWVGK
jgi:hypothetical protein